MKVKAYNYLYKTACLLVCLIPLLLLTQISFSQSKTTTNTKELTNIRQLKDSLNQLDSPVLKTIQPLTPPDSASLLKKKNNSDTATKKYVVIDSLNVKMSKDSLDAPVSYAASDSGVLEIKAKKFFLYGSASSRYSTMNLTSSVIEIDNATNTAKAYFTRDSSGKVLERPKLVDKDMESENDSIFYNFKTRKGLTKSTYTKQGEMFVYGERFKKINDDEYFGSRARFTTCNLDTPHFAFKANKVKLINKKWAFTGMVFPEFESVPLPIGLPFGIFPLSTGRHSGMLAPRFTTTQTFGIGLEGLGYYHVLSDHFDILTRANIYSYGGYSINVSPTYRKRYKYQGALRLDYNVTKINFKGDPDFSKTKTFNVTWSHTNDSKKRPGTAFAANVNFGSSRFNRLVANNNALNFTNKTNSSISYSKTANDGSSNLSITANHSQDNNLGRYDISLPNVNYTLNTLYPLKKRESVGESKWYEKLGVGYTGSLQNRFTFFTQSATDTTIASYHRKMSLGEILDTMQWGATHSIPITLALPAMGAIQLSPSISFQEKWYGSKFSRSWNGQKVDTLIEKGFYSAREMSFGLSANTAIFGTFNFGKNKRVQAIRHVIRPSIGLSYKPDMNKSSYYTTQIDSLGRTSRFSYYEGSIAGAFGEGKFGGLTFGIQNNLEMKVRDKSDTTNENATKKVKIIDNFAITSAYNLMADSFALSPINIIIGTSLFNNVNITGSTTLNPYKVDRFGRQINEYTFSEGKLGRITNGSLSFSTSFKSKQGDQKANQTGGTAGDGDRIITPEEQQRELEYIRNNPSEFADFDIPWSVNVGFSMNFNRTMKPDYSGFQTNFYSSVNLNGDFNFSPKWKMGGNTFLDVKTMKVGSLSLFVSREMHCWQMSINVTPIGIYRSFNITISPKSGILRDLKVNRTRQFYM